MALQPALETPTESDGAKLKIWAHGYPYRTVRWHYHPEFEIHLVTTTHGRVFVGDHIGVFAPGDLVLLGPNLPHNWVSDVPPELTIPERCIVLQFSARIIDFCFDAFQIAALCDLARDAARGIAFAEATSRAAAPLMREMLDGDAVSHPALFLRIVELLIRDERRRPLASVGYQSQPELYGEQPLNHVLDHIKANLPNDLSQTHLARASGYTTSGFSRAFRRQTGMAFVKYVTNMRINRACALLATSDQAVTDICYDSGFSNLSNFNRRFLAVAGMTPRQYRQHSRQNTDHLDVTERKEAKASAPPGLAARG